MKDLIFKIKDYNKENNKKMNQNLKIFYNTEDDTLEIFIDGPAECYFDEIE